MNGKVQQDISYIIEQLGICSIFIYHYVNYQMECLPLMLAWNMLPSNHKITVLPWNYMLQDIETVFRLSIQEPLDLGSLVF
jgi:hypothetical protein